MSANSSKTENSPFCRFLKFWRGVKNISQEQLAFQVDSSARHISRIENGSSRPSEALVLQIAQVLELGQRDTNHLLIAAGYMAQPKPADFNAPEYRWLRNAVTRQLKALDPYPTTVMDSSGQILMVNKGWVGFFSQAISAERLNKVSHHYEFIFSREGVGNIVSDWENTLSVILMSIKQRALFSDDPAHLAIFEKLRSHNSVPDDWAQRGSKLEPMASFRVKMQIKEKLHSFFSVSSTIGALGPNAYMSEPNITINTFYPENEDINMEDLINNELEHPLLKY